MQLYIAVIRVSRGGSSQFTRLHFYLLILNNRQAECHEYVIKLIQYQMKNRKSFFGSFLEKDLVLLLNVSRHFLNITKLTLRLISNKVISDL